MSGAAWLNYPINDFIYQSHIINCILQLNIRKTEVVSVAVLFGQFLSKSAPLSQQ